MNKKKIVALVAATTMILGSVPVSAADTVTPSATATGGATVSGGSTVIDFNKDPKYEVTLPTAAALSFTIDPHNLINVASGTSVALDTATGSAGIIPASGSAAIITNESSVPIEVTATFTAADSATTGAALVTDPATVKVATSPTLLLAVVPSSKKTKTVTGYSAGSTVVPVVSGGSTATFNLAAATYEVKAVGDKSFELSKKAGDDNYDGTAFKLGGEVAKSADWTAYTGDNAKSITLTAVFEYKKIDAVSATPVSGAYGLATASAVVEDYTAPGASGGGAAATDDYVMENQSGATVYTFVNAPSGTITAMTIDGTSRIGAVTGGNITYSNGVLTINSTASSTFFATSGSHTIAATIGGQAYTLTYTN